MNRAPATLSRYNNHIQMEYFPKCNCCPELASVKCVCEGSEFFGCPTHFGIHSMEHKNNQYHTQRLLISISDQQVKSIQAAEQVSFSLLQSRIDKLIQSRDRAVESLLAQIRLEFDRCSNFIEKIQEEKSVQQLFLERLKRHHRIPIISSIQYFQILKELKNMNKLDKVNIEKALRGEIEIKLQQGNEQNSYGVSRVARQKWEGKEHTDRVWSVSVQSCSGLVCSGSEDKTLKLWEISTGNLLKTLKGHSLAVNTVHFSPNGQLVASGSDDKTVKVWQGDKCITTFHGHSKAVLSVSFSPCGKYLASGSADKMLKVWSTETWKLLITYSEHSKLIRSVNFSRFGPWLGSGSNDKTIKIRSIESQTCILTIQSSNKVNTIEFSPCAAIIASGTQSKVELWEVLSGNLIFSLDGHTSWVQSVSFSECGEYLASASRDKTVRVWDVSAGTILHTLSTYQNWVFSVCFSNQGRMLATGGRDKQVKMWTFEQFKFV